MKQRARVRFFDYLNEFFTVLFVSHFPPPVFYFC